MSTPEPIILRLGTRGSLLARMQSDIVARALEAAHLGLRVETTLFKTTGDQIADRPLHEMGGKGLFTKELEIALLENRVDFAVHSFKDMPTTMPLVDQRDLIVTAVPPREDPRDLLVARGATTVAQLPENARVGTGSLRRRCQLLAARPDLRIETIRGNIDTRLRKCREGQYDAVVLAMAGVRRAGLFDPAIMAPIDHSTLLPAPGQGALALQCRRADAITRNLLSVLNDSTTAACVEAERALVELLKGDCMSPIAALAEIQGDRIKMHAVIGARGGGLPVICGNTSMPLTNPRAAAMAVYGALAALGVERLLNEQGS